MGVEDGYQGGSAQRVAILSPSLVLVSGFGFPEYLQPTAIGFLRRGCSVLIGETSLVMLAIAWVRVPLVGGGGGTIAIAGALCPPYCLLQFLVGWAGGGGGGVKDGGYN
jgi:hypothetical protein